MWEGGGQGLNSGSVAGQNSGKSHVPEGLEGPGSHVIFCRSGSDAISLVGSLVYYYE